MSGLSTGDEHELGPLLEDIGPLLFKIAPFNPSIDSTFSAVVHLGHVTGLRRHGNTHLFTLPTIMKTFAVITKSKYEGSEEGDSET